MGLPNPNITTVIRYYYEKVELSNEDIRAIFDYKIGGTLLQSLKKKAISKMIECDTPAFNKYSVNTHSAYAAWGFDISDFESRYNRLKKLGLLDKSNAAE